MEKIKRVVVSGGAGQISYSLLFRIANGDLLGKNQSIELNILEVPQALDSLKGVVMELEDCCFPLLKGIKTGSDPIELFEEVNFALLVGSKPRSAGMERKDLLLENAKIFVEQGKALNKVAAKDVKVLVVGNPCNTNCLIAIHNAPNIPKSSFYSMMRLDENRAKGFLAKKAHVGVNDIKNMIIWGSHSSTQVPDFFHAKIKNKNAVDLIDKKWLEDEFVERVQKRGAEVIAARGKSSAASAANAVIDTIVALEHPTEEDNSQSVAMYSEGNPYGIDEDLVFSFPCKTKKDLQVSIVKGIQWNSYLEQKIHLTHKELKEERDMVSSML